MTLALLAFLVFVFLGGVLVGMVLGKETTECNHGLVAQMQPAQDAVDEMKGAIEKHVTFLQPSDAEEMFENMKDLDDLNIQANYKKDA